jgi:bifunctional non-homologous end joining protein LigD
MLRFVPPCLPIKSAAPPSGPLWLHEIKHDGFRIIACKDGPEVRLYSRPGNDLTNRFPLIVESLSRLRCKSCVIDGEAVACGADGRSSFDFIRYRHHDEAVFLYAFDLLQLGVDDLRVIHWKCVRPPWSRSYRVLGPASDTTSTSRATPRISSGTPVS